MVDPGDLTLENGGELPAAADVVSQTMDDVGKNIAPYALAALGHALISIPVVLMAVVLMFIVLFVLMMGGLVGGIGLASVLPQGNEEVGALIAQLIMMVGLWGTMAIMMVCMASILAPLNASLYRAMAAHQRGERELDIGACFRTVTQDMGKVMGTAFLNTSLTMLGALFCGFPGLIIAFFFSMAGLAAALHGLGPVASLRLSASHARAHTGWHLPFYGMYIGMSMIAGYVPILGTAFIMAFHTRAYRKLMGDGAEPSFQA